MRWNGRWRCVRRNAGNWTLRVRRHWRRRTRHRLGSRACPRLRSGVEHPFLKVKRIFGYAKSLPSSPIGGALPGTGEEHGASGAVIWTGQPADGGGSLTG